MFTPIRRDRQEKALRSARPRHIDKLPSRAGLQAAATPTAPRPDCIIVGPECPKAPPTTRALLIADRWPQGHPGADGGHDGPSWPRHVFPRPSVAGFTLSHGGEETKGTDQSTAARPSIRRHPKQKSGRRNGANKELACSFLAL